MHLHSAFDKKNNLFVALFSLCFCISQCDLNAQLKVLFLGNSYTGVNNLPQLVHDVALSAGDTLIFDSNAPGGYTLMDHSIDLTSQSKIMAGGWNYVVIQGQSQEPVIATNQFNNGGSALYSQIRQYNTCAVIMPYMTWGRKNGDASTCPNYPLMCTYQKMDSTLKEQYLSLTAVINGEVSPVSVVWKYLRQNYPGINLYQSDDSHPSAEGSFAAACCFYTSLFKKDPTLITYNFGLNSTDASNIKNAVKTQVYDSLQFWNFKKLPISKFGYQIGSGNNQVIFSPSNQGTKQTYFWDFGDGTNTTTVNPVHSYTANGTYTVSLTTTNCDMQGTHSSFTDTIIQFCSHTPTISTSHPWLCQYDTLWTQPANAYQWYYYGVPLPVTTQYLPNYSQYNLTGFSVISTLNGCSELSQTFTQTAQWSGYYFDAMGDPCVGDTVRFAVLHINGFLSGSENILWYNNGTLLSSMTNQDTLLITGSGKYQCKVINPNTNCPLDTTISSLLEYNCGTITSLVEKDQELSWNIFPNPATETINISLTKFSAQNVIQIYNATGRIIKLVTPSGAITKLNISDLPPGLYYLRLKNNNDRTVKFIKQ
jgi:PKD repeat protein